MIDKCQLKLTFCFHLSGALFDVNVDENKQIFQYAIEKANEKLLAEEEFRLEGEVAEIDFGNELNISRSLCGMFEVLKRYFLNCDNFFRFFPQIFSFTGHILRSN